MDRVAFEAFNLGGRANLVNNSHFTQVAAPLRALGAHTAAMVSTYHDEPPHRRDDDIVWLRRLFEQPTLFVAQSVAACAAEQLSSMNMDLEPPSNVTAADGIAYAAFLTTLARTLHQHGRMLSVDAASWSPLWNFTLLRDSAVDEIVTMDTYAANFEDFDAALARAAAQIGPGKLRVGLLTRNGNTGAPLDAGEVARRLDRIMAHNITRIGIWPCTDVAACTDIVPRSWWPQLERFVRRGPVRATPRQNGMIWKSAGGDVSLSRLPA